MQYRDRFCVAIGFCISFSAKTLAMAFVSAFLHLDKNK